ncbi:ABC transporter substrate-binding protein [Nitrincola alkalilacustris]|uniref:ABC transporter substrate-binding protein n=1 Tax=Nitrincola alkalilacustris TaxID=1571224 RepID=UPI0014578702|nr:ABC transporter substrate-binding protein [Nitrincola alkalilacustris]
MYKLKFSRMRFSAFMLVVLLFSASGVVASSSVRLGGSGWVADAPTKVADLKGYFNPDSAEPPIEVLYFNSGKEALESLLRGDLEVALAATSPVAIQLLRTSEQVGADGDDLVILSSVSLSNQSHYIIAAADRGIHSAEELNGRRVGVMLGTSAHFAWYRFAITHALMKSEITLVDIPISEQSQRLLAGEVDAVVSWDPWGLQIQQALAGNAVTFTAREIHTVDWLIVTRRGFAEANPDLMDRILSGYAMAIEFIQKQPESARQLHADFSGLPSAELAQMEQGIIWRMALNWAVLANVEAQFQWLNTWPEYTDTLPPAPARYLHAEPFNRVIPGGVTLPFYMHSVD